MDKSNSKEENDSLLSILKCFVCSDLMEPPIYMCNNGHSVCMTCRPKLTSCSTCTAKFVGNNLQLEKIAELVLYPCKYEAAGCVVKVRRKDKETHEGNCLLRPSPCFFSDCTLRPLRRDILLHVDNDHPDKIIAAPVNCKQVIIVPLDTKSRVERILFTSGGAILITLTIEHPSIFLRSDFDVLPEVEKSLCLIFRIKHHRDPHNLSSTDARLKLLERDSLHYLWMWQEYTVMQRNLIHFLWKLPYVRNLSK